MRTLSIIQTLVTAAATALLVGMAGLVTSATPAAAATGYWLGGDDGGVFSFNAPYNGNLVFGGQFSAPGNSICAQGCPIGSGSSTANYWMLATADLNPNDFSDTTAEGLAALLFDGTHLFGGSPAAGPISPNPPATPISPLRPWRIAGVAGDQRSAWILNANGMVYSAGDAPTYGSMNGTSFHGSMVGIASTPDGKGYWLVASDGGVFTFGDAQFYGSMGAQHLDQPIVGMASTPDGRGYWLVAADGGVFSFGDAAYYGSMGGLHPNAPVVGIASAPDGKGYWLAASDGGVFAFGSAPFEGSMAGEVLSGPIVGIAAYTSQIVSPAAR
jgi:hypothetical protein